MATYMLINNPTLDGKTIKLELPNEGSKVDLTTVNGIIRLFTRKITQP